MDKMHEKPNIPGPESGTNQTGSRPSGEGGGKVMTSRCADVGIAGCRWEAAGRTEEELRSQIEQHGREAHGLREIGENMWQRMREKIRGRAA